MIGYLPFTHKCDHVEVSKAIHSMVLYVIVLVCSCATCYHFYSNSNKSPIHFGYQKALIA